MNINNYILATNCLARAQRGHAQLENLEAEFEEIAFSPIDVTKKSDFYGCEDPNEVHPENIKKHLQQISTQHIRIGTGVVRNFFHLAIDQSSNCEGLVIIDLSPRAIAHLHFDLMLFRISADMFEYVQLSSDPKFIDDILMKLNSSDMPEKVKTYYRENLKLFAPIYYSSKKEWRDPNFSGYQAVNYTQNEDQFNTIQQFAKSGKIIAKLGDINDLSFLGNKEVVVDLSNIPDYSIIDFKLGTMGPKILQAIWTQVNGDYPASYFSTKSVYIPTAEEREKLKNILDILGQANVFFGFITPAIILQNYVERKEGEVFYNDLKTISILESYKEQFLFEVSPTVGWVDFNEKNWNGLMGLRKLSLEECKKLSHSLPEQYKKVIIQQGKWHLSPQNYSVFTDKNIIQNVSTPSVIALLPLLSLLKRLRR